MSAPTPVAVDSVAPCDARLSAPPATVAGPRPTIESLASDRYLLRVTLTAAAHTNLRRAQDLLRHVAPNGDPGVVIEKALALLVAQLERQKVAKVAAPRSVRREPLRRSRHIPAGVRRTVWARDEGRCAFTGAHGRCRETGRLEFHHLVPFARGGAASVENIALRCQAHNGHESERLFGARPQPRPEAARARARAPGDRGANSAQTESPVVRGVLDSAEL